MPRAFLSTLALLAYFVQPVLAQPVNPTGVWRCIANSNIVSIDVVYQVSPDFSLVGQGSIVYVATSQIFQVQGYGSVSTAPPDSGSAQWLYRFQMAPQNHAVFSVFARPTQDQNALYNRFQDPNTGAVTETSCARVG